MSTEPQTTYDRRSGPRDRKLRVADHEREAVADILRREHVNGRLDVVEFQERLDRALAAKTYADLDALVADLPGDGLSRSDRRVAWTPRRRPVWLVPVLAVAAIVATGGHILWLAFPLVVLFVLRRLFWRPSGGGYGRWGSV